MEILIKDKSIRYLVTGLLLMTVLFVSLGYLNRTEGEGTLHTCIVESTGGIQSYGPTGQRIICKSKELGSITLRAPEGSHYKVGQPVEVVAFTRKLTRGKVYFINE